MDELTDGQQILPQARRIISTAFLDISFEQRTIDE
jgi:hypothetical protein